MSDADNGYERRLTAVGVWVAPPPTAAETQAAQERFRSAWRDGDPDPDAMPRVRLPAVPVFRDESGKTFLLLPNERGDVVAYPFAAAASGSESATAGGGYIPFEAMPSSPPAEAARTDALRRAATAQAASNAGLPADAAAAAGFDFGAAAEGALRSAGLGVVQHLATAGLTSAFASGGCLGGMGGALDVSAMGSALGGQLLGMGTQALFSSLWKVDDSSSMGEQLAHKYGQELLGALQGEATARLQSALGLGGGRGQGTASPAQKFKDFFGGASSSATKPAARLGDQTDHGGVVDSGAGTVQLGGVPAVRLSDHETCPKSEGPVPHVGGPVFEGNPTILIEGLPAAREGHQAMCMGVGIPTALKPAKSDVLLGETTVSLPPATESSSKASDSGGGSAQSSDTNPQSDSSASKDGKATQPKEEGGPPEAAAEPSSPPEGGQLVAGDKPLSKADAKIVSDKAYVAQEKEIITLSDGKEMIVKKVDVDPWTGYRSILLQPVDGKGASVLAFAGTDFSTKNYGLEFLKDGATDAAQAFGQLPPQYEIARVMAAKYGVSETQGLVLAGHSLGGGLAQYAGMMNGLPATGINAATLGVGAQWAIFMHGRPGAEANIVNHNNLEPVSLFGLIPVIHRQYGTIHTYPGVSLNPLTAFGHTLDQVDPFEAPIFTTGEPYRPPTYYGPGPKPMPVPTPTPSSSSNGSSTPGANPTPHPVPTPPSTR